MDTIVENIALVAAALPGFYGFICWIRRHMHAQRTAEWVKANHREEWDSLHWLAKRNAWAGIEVLIKKGLLSGPEMSSFRSRDEYLEKAAWVGLLISALLLLFVLVLKVVVV